MTRQRFSLRSCDWLVTVFYEATANDAEDILCALVEAGCSDAYLANAIENIKGGGLNCGLTYTNVGNGMSVVVIGETTSADEFANTYAHEQGHLVRHISQAFGLEPHGETEQYIAGEINQQMFAVAKKYLCEHCRSAKSTFYKSFGLH